MAQQPITGGYVPNPDHVNKLASEKGERDCDLAVRILEIASRRAPADVDAAALSAYAETLWQWVTTDTWDA